MRQLLARLLPFLFLLVLAIVSGLFVPGFIDPTNVANILRFSAVIVIMGAGMTFVIVSGGIDLSVGSVVAFSSIAAAWFITATGPAFAGLAKALRMSQATATTLQILVTILVGTLVGSLWGLLNGQLIAGIRLPRLTAALATLLFASAAFALWRWSMGAPPLWSVASGAGLAVLWTALYLLLADAVKLRPVAAMLITIALLAVTVFVLSLAARIPAGGATFWRVLANAGPPLLHGLLAGITVALFYALLAAGVRLPPFIATLATMWLARGAATLLARYITGLSTSIEVTTRGFEVLGGDAFHIPVLPSRASPHGVPVPTPVLVMFAVVALSHYVLNHTRLGRYAFALGSNVDAARYSGISVSRYTILYYVLLGALAGLAGMIEASINRGGHATLGREYELLVIAAVVIGGGSFQGGQGTILGTLTGALIMAVIRNDCILTNVEYEWQLVVTSVLIVVAVAFDHFQRRRTGA
jgi:ribose transport system permease protein